MTRRARSDADKELRRAAIVDAARELFDAVDIDDFTMDAVAGSLGLAKGTLYRYVPTREALLLTLTSEEYARWLDRVDAELPLGEGASAVPELLVDAILAEPRLLRLAALVGSVLERNVPLETAKEFKTFLTVRSRTTAELLATRLRCSPSRSAQLLAHLQALSTGLYHQAHPAPVIVEALADTSLAGLRIDLRSELLHGATALVRAATD